MKAASCAKSVASDCHRPATTQYRYTCVSWLGRCTVLLAGRQFLKDALEPWPHFPSCFWFHYNNVWNRKTCMHCCFVLRSRCTSCLRRTYSCCSPATRRAWRFVTHYYGDHVNCRALSGSVILTPSSFCPHPYARRFLCAAVIRTRAGRF